MKEAGFLPSASCDDPKIRFKHQLLLQDYHELRKETELKRRNLAIMKRKRVTLIAEVKFLRRRYKHLKQVETSPEMFRWLGSGDLEVPSRTNGKRKKQFGLDESVPCFDLKQKDIVCNDKEALAKDASCDLEKKVKRSRVDEVLTNSASVPYPKGDENVSHFDQNQLSRETKDLKANGEHIAAEATKSGMLGNRTSDLHGEIKLQIRGEVEKELSRAVKRKVTWQDPVALLV